MHQDPPTTAADLRRKFAASGISAAEISPDGISDIYSEFNKGEPPVKTDRATELMADKDVADPTDAPLGVIVETRSHPNLLPVVRQVLDQGINVQIFYGTENSDFVIQSFDAEIAAGRVHLTAMDYATLGRADYNGLLLSRAFWDALQSRGKILIFQTDAVLCGASSYRLQDFLEFDYIGSAWGRSRKRGLVVDGGNGGLSLRDWHLSVECIERFPPDIWWSGGEDTYFCFHIDLIGGRVARAEESARFGSQVWFLENSFGAHKVQQMNFINRTLFLAWCPEGKMVLPETSMVPEYHLGKTLKSLGLSGPLTKACRALSRV